jgi:hypothetical protein
VQKLKFLRCRKLTNPRRPFLNTNAAQGTACKCQNKVGSHLDIFFSFSVSHFSSLSFSTGTIDWCCFHYSIRNRLLALLEALCARFFLKIWYISVLIFFCLCRPLSVMNSFLPPLTSRLLCLVVALCVRMCMYMCACVRARVLYLLVSTLRHAYPFCNHVAVHITWEVPINLPLHSLRVAYSLFLLLPFASHLHIQLVARCDETRWSTDSTLPWCVTVKHLICAMCHSREFVSMGSPYIDLYLRTCQSAENDNWSVFVTETSHLKICVCEGMSQSMYVTPICRAMTVRIALMLMNGLV